MSCGGGSNMKLQWVRSEKGLMFVTRAGKEEKCVQAKGILNSCLLKPWSYFAPVRCKLDFTATVCCCYLRDGSKTEQDNVFCCNRTASVNNLFANW